MNSAELINHISSGSFDATLSRLYGEDRRDSQRARYLELVSEFASRYGADREVSLFSVPGRSELSGNHTDHNLGRVIACSIDLDIIAVAALSETPVIRVKSAGYAENYVDLDSFTEPREELFGKSSSLIAGVAHGFALNGRSIGGFDACTTSNVLKGSGLSSSAAFENMIGTILSHLYNGGEADYLEIAKTSQYAENVFFKKPCGLMDQVACAAGGIVSIDFKDGATVEKLDFDLTEHGYCLCIVNTGGNHADLTDDYAAVPAEMKAVASSLNETVLRSVDENEFIASIPELREKHGDRAVLRAMHFYAENRRVDGQKEALKRGDLEAFFKGVRESGLSSFCYLQNVYTVKNVREQGLSLALALSDRFFEGRSIPHAFRVHGGGFAGTVQCYLPLGLATEYAKYMNSVFGAGACHILHIRQVGATKMELPEN